MKTTETERSNNNEFLRPARRGEPPPHGMRLIGIEGLEPAWVDSDLANEVEKLITNGKAHNAKTLMQWFGAKTVDDDSR
jgi:hypothetical protein